MKIKLKITSTILSMMLALGVMGFAVYAAATQTLIVNNTVSFVSKHVIAEITGDVSGTIGGNVNYNKQPGEHDYYGKVDSSLDETKNFFPEWEIGNVGFAAETAPITITMIVNNLSKERFLTFSLATNDGSVWNGENLGEDTNNNITRTVKYTTTNTNNPVVDQTYTSGAVVVEKEQQATIVIQLFITDTGRSVNDFKNSFTLTLKDESETTSQPEEPTGEFVFDTQNQTLLVPANTAMTYENLPDMNMEGKVFYGLYEDKDFTQPFPIPSYVEDATTLHARIEPTPEYLYFDYYMESDENNIETVYHYVSNNYEYYDTHGGLPEVIEIPAMYEGIMVDTISYFGGDDNIKKFIMPNTIKTIQSYAFSECFNLIEIDIPDSVENIGEYAFNGTAWFNEVEDVNGVVYAGNVAYSYKGDMEEIISIVLKDETISIAPYAFAGLNKLASVMIPKDVKFIASDAFAECVELSQVTFASNSNLKKISSNAFYGCELLSTIALPNSLEFFASSAFNNAGIKNNQDYYDQATGLIYISNWLIGYDWWNIPENENRNLEINEGTVGIAYGAFEGGESSFWATSLTIPASLKYFSNYDISYCGLVSDFTVHNDNQVFASDDGVLYNKNKDLLIKFPSGKEIEEFTIPSTVTTIGSSAFFAVTLSNIVIPSSVTTINESAFSFNKNSTVTRIYIPRTVTNMGNGAFAEYWGVALYCETETLPSGWDSEWYGQSQPYYGVSQVKKYNDLFEYIIVDDEIVITRDLFMKNDIVVIPSQIEGKQVTRIGKWAFSYNHNLKSVYIPSTVTKIDGSAFTSLSYGQGYNRPSKFRILVQETSIPEGWHSEWCGFATVVHWGVNELKNYNDEFIYYISNDEKAIIVQGFEDITNLVIPEKIEDCAVTQILTYAFSNNENLISVELNENLLSIGSRAFEDCINLASVVVPSTLESSGIGSYAFQYCSKLNSVYVNSQSIVNAIDYSQATNGHLLGYLTKPEGRLYINQNIVVGTNVTTRYNTAGTEGNYNVYTRR